MISITIRVKLLLLQEAILQQETMRKAGDWQQVEKNDGKNKISRWFDGWRIRGRSIKCLNQANKQLTRVGIGLHKQGLVLGR